MELLRYGARAAAVGAVVADLAPFKSSLASPPSAFTTVSELRSLVPKEPLTSLKPWNSVTREQIDGCLDVLDRIAGGWSFEAHPLFPPGDRDTIESVVLGQVRSELEKRWGVCREVWWIVLSYCDRGWFAT